MSGQRNVAFSCPLDLRAGCAESLGPGAALAPLTDTLMRQALLAGRCDRVLRYFGRPVDAEGQPHPAAAPEVLTRAKRWHEGVRVRHWVDDNSVKVYNEHHVLRAQVADDVNRRFTAQLAAVRNDTPVRELFAEVTRPFVRQGRRVRALDVAGKDRELLLALTDPRFAICGVTNRRLQQLLARSPWGAGRTQPQLSARITRHLTLLRQHGILRKQPNQRSYLLTDKGRSITAALAALLAASTQQLMEKAA